MENFGVYNSAHGADRFGFRNLKRLFWNLEAPALYEHALANREAQLIQGGALAADTGVHTGRSPQDKFVVRDAKTENEVWWDNNAAMTPEQFELLLGDFLAPRRGQGPLRPGPLRRRRSRDTGCGRGSSPNTPGTRSSSATSCSGPSHDELAGYVPDLTIVDLPSFKADPARHGTRSETVIAVDFTPQDRADRRHVLCRRDEEVGLHLSQLRPAEEGHHADALLGECRPRRRRGDLLRPVRHRQDDAVEPIRTASCSATTSTAGGRTASSISRAAATPRPSACRATPSPRSTPRPSASARCSRTSSSTRSPALPDFDDASKTENTRCAYPLDFIPNASRDRPRRPSPKNIVMLTADAFGVLPPIAKLTGAEAMYHFLSGYTAKVAGTEKGLKGPEATFSTCFGAPFMPRHPSVYGNLLRDLIAAPPRRLLARQHRLDRRRRRRRPAHADPRHAAAADRGARRLAVPRRFPPRPLFRLRGADLGAGRRAAHPLSGQDLAGQSRLRRDGKAPRRHVRGRTSSASRPMSTPT